MARYSIVRKEKICQMTYIFVTFEKSIQKENMSNDMHFCYFREIYLKIWKTIIEYCY